MYVNVLNKPKQTQIKVFNPPKNKIKFQKTFMVKSNGEVMVKSKQ